MRPLTPDARLSAVASLFAACDCGADIGADHGRLSCYLLETGVCARMIASDISAPSLDKARALLTRRHMDARASFIVADGLDALRPEVSCAAICGMGGTVIARMLLRGRERLGKTALVLSAHTDLPLLRKTVYTVGYTIHRELVVKDGRRFYTVLKAAPGIGALDEEQAYVGLADQCLGAPLSEYFTWRCAVTACERNDDAPRRLAWLKEALERAKAAERE